MKTPERIVHASLRLFNDLGERAVSTNHIAAYLEMSPGNLYYHYANKREIVAVLFGRYEQQVRRALAIPATGAPTVDELRGHLTELLGRMWHFRFFYRDLEHLLEADPALASRYRAFSGECQALGRRLIQRFVDHGILALDARQAEALTLNVWIVLTGWVRYCCTHDVQPQHEAEVIHRGCYQVLSLASGFVQARWLSSIESLLSEFGAPLMMQSDQGPG
ncbi:TetR/AcrR family transcriptional regulator [Pseudomonas typographi]|uniref:TetR/AcrR family transcriptional regulator n=1 Tax=Pseudomonas typographi TaxID=2715964 RepID=UPI0016867786|nr:TetR/AcrR family transcriptional regulator [Pseudomonas typographi]MBD1585341.1 TetR/AcrR family transcriptional regulator [Pseudomonas typographi]